MQVDIESGLENLAKRHLQLKGFPATLIKKLRITLPEPSDMSAKRKLDLDQAKIGIISQVQNLGLLPKKQIYMEYFDMTEEEAERTIQEMKSEQAEAAAEAAAAQTDPGAAGAPAAPAMESAENTAPTANESTESPVEFMLNRTLDEEAKEVMARIVEKQKQKAEEMLKS